MNARLQVGRAVAWRPLGRITHRTTQRDHTGSMAEDHHALDTHFLYPRRPCLDERIRTVLQLTQRLSSSRGVTCRRVVHVDRVWREEGSEVFRVRRAGVEACIWVDRGVPAY